MIPERLATLKAARAVLRDCVSGTDWTLQTSDLLAVADWLEAEQCPESVAGRPCTLTGGHDGAHTAHNTLEPELDAALICGAIAFDDGAYTDACTYDLGHPSRHSFDRLCHTSPKCGLENGHPPGHALSDIVPRLFDDDVRAAAAWLTERLDDVVGSGALDHDIEARYILSYILGRLGLTTAALDLGPNHDQLKDARYVATIDEALASLGTPDDDAPTPF